MADCGTKRQAYEKRCSPVQSWSLDDRLADKTRSRPPLRTGCRLLRSKAYEENGLVPYIDRRPVE